MRGVEREITRRPTHFHHTVQYLNPFRHGAGARRYPGVTRNFMSVFFSLPVPEHIGEILVAFQDELRQCDTHRRLRYSKREDFQITLGFLGDLPESEYGRVIEIGRKVGEYHPPVRARLSRVCALPERGPTIGYVGCLESESWSLGGLIRHEAGLPEYENTHDVRMPGGTWPTITLARGRPKADAESFGKLLCASMEGKWVADSFQLVESLTGRIPKYRVIEEFELEALDMTLVQAALPFIQFS
jgi:2'-5' RNA ligase